jgi:hypothetical protein
VAISQWIVAWNVDLTIRYSDERLCEIVTSRPDAAAPLYRIASRRATSARASPKQCVKRDAFMKSPRDRIEAGEAILDPKQRGRAEVKLKFFAVQEFQVSF